ncbi:MAG: TIGR02186 family protein [Paracoccaceae bacterium]
MIRALIFALLLLPAAVQAETIVAGLSQNSVSITTNFDGSEILIYGAIKRDAPSTAEKPLEVIITVEGPSVPMTIRHKDRKSGIWMNTGAVTIDSAPTFYTVATTGPLGRVLKDTDNLRHRITIPRVIRAVGITDEAEGADQYVREFLRLQDEAGVYRQDQGAVELLEQTLFRTDVSLPANLTDGEYRVRIFLTRDGRVVDHQERVIGVRKAGIERFLFNLAQDHPLLSGIASVLMAVLAGSAASAAFRLIRN